MFHNYTKVQKEKAANEFMILHQAATDPCKFDYRLNGNSIEFFSIHSTTLHCIDSIVKFANYHKANIHCVICDGKVVARVF